VAIVQGVREAVVDGNDHDGLCYSRLHAGIGHGKKQRGKKGKGMTGRVHWSATQARG
jgi:hypothetical protein